MRRDPYWNHNTHYHPWLLRQLPDSVATALDVGCGDGLLARKLATRCESVLGVDSDAQVLDHADPAPQVRFRQEDFRRTTGTFEVVTAVAVLHHVPLVEGLTALRRLVAPGGLLLVIGLWKSTPRHDFGYLPLLPATSVVQALHRHRRGDPDVTLRDPVETIGQIRTAAAEILPGARIRRRLMWRYTLRWRNPARRPADRIGSDLAISAR
ncbi:class I SAM-dependent methyltransferase [Nocardia paucivorans]|uniref:class I SAM-dependent methyltransferase n=1 Tax=Nocardia paucivorans TaxID=114259 RepID=UPI000302CF92|nr:class I SAM-dependent methyltransferase [Nocardia paucivorans]